MSASMADQSAPVLRVPAETARALRDPALAEELRAYLLRWVVISPSVACAAAAVGLEWLRDRLVVEAAPEWDRSPGVRLIEEERLRQLERYDGDHDDRMVGRQLADMAGWWLHPDSVEWPWDDAYPDRGSAVEQLVRAGALIAAEIDRRLRDGERPCVVTGEVVTDE